MLVPFDMIQRIEKLELGDHGYDDSDAVVKPGDLKNHQKSESDDENASSDTTDDTTFLENFPRSTWNASAKPGKSCLVNYRKQSGRRRSRDNRHGTQGIDMPTGIPSVNLLKIKQLEREKNDFYAKIRNRAETVERASQTDLNAR